jgi:hypothetical protein
MDPYVNLYEQNPDQLVPHARAIRHACATVVTVDGSKGLQDVA